MTQQTSTAIFDCQAISEAFLALHEQDGFARLPPSSLLHDSVPMSFVMSAGLIQVENELEQVVQKTGGKFAFTQPCFRHFDMKQVGEDPTRLSLFHMSAAFHIGCSERETVLPRLWHFLTDTLGLEKERLWMTYLDDPEFGRDERSYQCWKALGVAEARLVGLDQQHCFWRQRSLGQIANDGKKCGPHTEVFYERVEVNCPNCENKQQPIGTCRCGHFVEISNSLFIENYVADDGKLTPADTVFAECVVGLERIEMILQGVPSVYHTQRFHTWRGQLTHNMFPSPLSSGAEISLNIILDHLSAFVKLAKDGAPAPGRGGRKHIMRKLARGVMEHMQAIQPTSDMVLIRQLLPGLPDIQQQLVSESVKSKRSFQHV
jgi:alanyl-tRNA synthetase